MFYNQVGTTNKLGQVQQISWGRYNKYSGAATTNIVEQLQQIDWSSYNK